MDDARHCHTCWPPTLGPLHASQGLVCGMGGQVQPRAELHGEEFQGGGAAGILCRPPHLPGDVVFLWDGNLLAHFIKACLAADSVLAGGPGRDQSPGSPFSRALAVLSYSVFAMGMATRRPGSDLLAADKVRLQARPPFCSPVFQSYIRCWKYVSEQGRLFRGFSLQSGLCVARNNRNPLKYRCPPAAGPPCVRPNRLGAPA